MPASPRFSLRFEEPIRQGEVVRLDPLPLIVGRNGTHGLVISHPSVSGKHAEFLLDSKGLVVRDLGSTNGMRVGGRKVDEAHLAHGDRVQFGQIQLTVLDAELLDAPSAGSGASDSGATSSATGDAGEGLQSISADALERSSKKSLVGLLGLLGLAAAGAGAWWYFSKGAGAGAGPISRTVTPVAGNLLASSYSFEGEEPAWTSDEGGSASFFLDPEGASSGEVGIAVDLEEAEHWATHISPWFAVEGQAALEVGAECFVDDSTRLRLGLEFGPENGDTEAALSMRLWGDWKGGDVGSLVLNADVPRGFARARALVQASGTGFAGVDDVYATPDAASQSGASLGEAHLTVVGGRVASLRQVSRVLLSGLRAEAGVPAPTVGQVPFTAVATATGFHVSFGEGAKSLVFVSERTEAGIATLGEGDVRGQSVAFEDVPAKAVLLGKGLEQVCLKFPGPVRVAGRPQDGRFHCRVDLAGAREFDIQITFAEGKAEAARLADLADSAQRKDAVGQAIGHWNRLLAEVPFDAAMVQRARSSRADLIQRGLEELEEVKSLAESANFFRLVDLYRQSHTRALETAQRYTGTEVEGEARKLADSVAADLAVLEAELAKTEVARLTSIQAVLVAQGSEQLAGAVQHYLESHLQGGR